MTELETRCLALIRETVDATGASPTRVEIADRLDVSVGTANDVINRLEKKGIIRRDRGSVRNLRVVGDVDLTIVPTSAIQAELARRGETFGALARDEGLGRGTRPCAGTFCDRRVRRGMLFCYDHWCALPGNLRERILAAFGRKDETAYREAVRAAIEIADEPIDHCGWVNA